MKKAENIRQEIFDKINAMSDDELARVIWKNRIRNSGAAATIYFRSSEVSLESYC